MKKKISNKPKKKGIGKNRTRRQFPRRPGREPAHKDALNLWKTVGIFTAWTGHGSRATPFKFKRRWWGPKQTWWLPDPKTGRLVKMGHSRV